MVLTMISKIIHYCWFGGNELPNDAKQYIQTWRRMLKEYKIPGTIINNYENGLIAIKIDENI